MTIDLEELNDLEELDKKTNGFTEFSNFQSAAKTFEM